MGIFVQNPITANAGLSVSIAFFISFQCFRLPVCFIFFVFPEVKSLKTFEFLGLKTNLKVGENIIHKTQLKSYITEIL